MVNHGHPGWYGTGFIILKPRSIAFPFKLEVFENESKNMDTGISLYYPIIEDFEKDLIFVKSGQKKNRTSKDYFSLYILRTKDFANHH